METPFDIISTDFDGTLFAEFENPPVPLRLQRLIGGLQGSGVTWVINTGRDMSSLMETLGRSGLGIKPDYLVLVEREIHFRHESQYVSLEEWNSACARDHAALFARVRADLPRLVEWIDARFEVTLYEDAYSPFCMIAGNNGDADTIQRFLDDYCRTIPDLALVRNDVYARFSHQAYNKGTALTEISQRLGVGPHRVCAIGDHLNDWSMLSKERAHLLATPANAVAAVKARVLSQGGYVSQLAYGSGVAEALEHFLGGWAGPSLDD